ncbi:MAG: MBL fold metallo-hydrolase [Candidatus Aureabacteria bacterium]|nr:MBL fold metallo-hydrolase [Candidatus Auribacterota bacterium]
MSKINQSLLLVFVLVLLGNGIILERIHRQKHLFLYFIDIGQGDASLLQYSGKNILIDGGDRPAGKSRVKSGLTAFLSSQGVRKIDLMILSHPHADHLGGLVEVMKRLPVDMILQSPGGHNTLLYRQFMEIARRRNIRMIKALRGMIISCGETDKIMSMEILSPDQNFQDKDLDNQSVVLRITHLKHKILFTGDIRIPMETRLIALDKKKLQADILKIPHHGSKTSSGLVFLKTVHPQIAVISCGKNNKYGFPHAEAINRIRKNCLLLHRTDEDGTLKILFLPERFVLTPHYTKKWWRPE